MLPLSTHIGQYRLVEFLGMGGMGEVYRAVHTRIDRVVALKVLSRTDRDLKFVQRFLNEARIHAGLHHPNIVTLYEFLEFEGKPCIVMEYVDGPTLADQLRVQAPLPLSEATFIFQRVADAIRYIHDHGVAHRDLKSNNIKISTRNEVKLLDFGIARDVNTPTLTREGNFIGTIQYLAPEQLMGATTGGRSSDIWGLGVLLYEMVTGKLPFEAESLTECFRKIDSVNYLPPESLNPALPQEARALIHRCLQKRPSHRYETAQDLLHDIERLAAVVSQPRLSTIGYRRKLGLDVHNWVAMAYDQWPLWVAGGALVILIITGMFLNLRAVKPAQRPEVSHQQLPSALPPDSLPSVQRLVPVSIDSLPSRAKVYQNGQHMADTPWEFEAAVGSRIDAVLKHDGLQDIRIQIHVGEHSNHFVEPFKPPQ